MIVKIILLIFIKNLNEKKKKINFNEMKICHCAKICGKISLRLNFILKY